MNTQRP
ncbi:Protein of unknown function [Propionibacterium freudenreichii subsp. freudenreichii]|nr:Protein of unknown function [Propionibacterium freudenreichii]CEP26982.1 Protein of unknown function [Propionibacterium freudenreichii subsp. freudenreichii]CEG93428.1 Protein of unknown function [Propionibacterium freudenreichii]CEH04066.1 Protein of unknown function [Propionibacterium freudenreichii]CEH08982.1 Protein of unknown function [Propionibacterium freudenreichii]